MLYTKEIILHFWLVVRLLEERLKYAKERIRLHFFTRNKVNLLEYHNRSIIFLRAYIRIQKCLGIPIFFREAPKMVCTCRLLPVCYASRYSR